MSSTPEAPWLSTVVNASEEQERSPDETDRDLERKAQSYLDAIRSCSPKCLELVERFRPMVDETFAKIQADYRSLTGNKETFRLEIVQGGFRNAFMLSPINTVVLTMELFEEAVRLAMNREGIVDQRLLRNQLRYVIAHEFGHKHHGTFREDFKKKMEERRAQGDKAASLTSPEIAEILEQRAHHISLESACDRFAIDLARNGGEEVDGLLLGLHLIKKLQDREEIEAREKRNRMTFEVIKDKDTGVYFKDEKEEEDEETGEQAESSGDEHEEWGRMSLFYDEEDGENEEEGQERKKGIEKDARALLQRAMSADEERQL
ncbi:MAG: M48 family metalloprotease [Patescibacteria group bacterium]